MCLPDNDVGKSVREGYRNITKEGDLKRVFGIPTLRTDI